MSNIIPMVSASPPPIDDGGGFGWDDDDDDFGTFASADNSFKTPGNQVNHDDSVPENNTEEDDFADFESFSDQTTFKTVSSNVKESSCENRPDSITIIDDQVNEIDDVSVKTDNQNCGSSNGALIDSGVYSSNISPVQQCDNSSVYRDCIEDFGSNSTVVDSVSQQESIADTVDSCDAHLNIPSDEKIPQVVFLDDHKANETENSAKTELNSSQTNIPFDDIPLNLKKDVVNLDDNNPDSEFKEIQSDSSARSGRDSDNESMSLETFKESVNINSQEPHCCQSQLQSDLNIESDFQTHTTEPLNTNQEPDDVNCAPDLIDPGNISTENSCDIVSSTSKERISGDSSDLYTTLDADGATADILKTNSVNSENSVFGHSCNNDSSVGTETSTDDPKKTILNSADEEVTNIETQSHKANDLTEKTGACASSESHTSNLEENKSTDNSGDINETLHSNDNRLTNDGGEFSNIKYSNIDCDVRSDENEDFGEFNTSSVSNDSCDKNAERANSGNEGDDDFGDFGEFGDFSQNVGQDSKIDDAKGDSDENGDFGSFSADFDQNLNKDDFGDFNATFESDSEKMGEPNDDWAAFSGPQIVNNADTQNDDDDDDEEWSGFADDNTETLSQQISHDNAVHENAASLPPDQLSKMSKQEKIIYAVTACFPALFVDMDTDSGEDVASLSEFTLVSGDTGVWNHVKSQRTTDALTYQWTKSQWNAQLFTTLHVDTRNILIGHKKAVVPVFASGLTLLEPTKGSSTSLKPDVLVDTSKSDSTVSSNSQESIPAAEFDWSGSGLTNPLEANNKTLNLDFLIQDQATKSNALESEFIGTNDSPVHKPTIQPLENILANLKPTSTFRPTNQNEDYSKEASKVVQSLPDLSFMTSKVLMFPVKIDGL